MLTSTKDKLNAKVRTCENDNRKLNAKDNYHPNVYSPNPNLAQILTRTLQFELFCMLRVVMGLPKNRTSQVYGHNCTVQHLERTAHHSV